MPAQAANKSLEDRERIGRLETQVASIAGDVGRIEHAMTDGFSRIGTAIEAIQKSKQVNWALVCTVAVGGATFLGTFATVMVMFVSVSLEPAKIELSHAAKHRMEMAEELRRVSQQIDHELQQYDAVMRERVPPGVVQEMQHSIAELKALVNGKTALIP